MAKTQDLYTGNGSTTEYPFTFEYLKQTDIKIQLDAQVTTAWSLANATTIAFDSAPGNDVRIKIYRETDTDTSPATFYAGSAIKSEDLNDNFTQNLYANQEISARYLSNLGGTMTGNLTMGEDAKLVFEGATDDAHETTLYVTDPTADRTITLPNVTGTVITTGDTGSVATGMIAADAITNAKIADNALDSEHYTDGSIDADHLASSSVTTAKINADAVTGAKIADNAIDSEHYTDGSIDTAHIADSQVTSAKIADGTIVAADLASDSVTTAKITDANVTTAKIAADAITAAKIADDVVNSEHYAAGSIDTEHIADLNVTTAKIAADAITGAKIADDTIDSEHYAAGSIDLEHMSSASVDSDNIVDDTIVNADINSSAAIAHSKLAALSDTNILVGNGSNVPVGVAVSGDVTIANTGAVTIANDAVEIGMIGCEQTTISDSDSHIPTSGAVVDYVAAQIAPIGGFEVIATEVAFPTTATQPASGVVISIADAGGVVFNGSGVSTTGRTTDGSPATVTISGAPSSLYSETLVAGVGMQVSSTGSGNNYTYHKILAKESDVKQLSDDINDFNARYRVNAGEPGSSNDAGDLVFDTNASKMKVYDGSSWGEVTSTGDFKYLVMTNPGTTDAATLTNSTFDLKETSTSGSAASVTSAAQLIVSVNGVIQKANTGTSAPAEGFALSDADTIVFSSAPGAGASIFIVQVGSAVSIPTPGDGTVTAAKIGAGAVTAAKIGTSAVETAKINADAVTGAKIADDAIDSEHIAAGAIDLEHVSSESVDEDNLHISNAGSNGDYLTKQSGDSGGLTWLTPPTAPTTHFATLNDTKSQGTGGGTYTSANTWVTRVLNTETDPDGIVSLSSNQFTLGAGKYLIRFSSPCWQIQKFHSRLYDVTNSSEKALGNSQYANEGGWETPFYSQGAWAGTINGNTVYRIEFIASHSWNNASALGLSANISGVSEVYTTVEITKTSL